MALADDAMASANSFAASAGVTRRVAMQALVAACATVVGGASNPPPPPVPLSWRRLPNPAWGGSITTLHGSCVWQGHLHFTTGGTGGGSAQLWRWDGTTFTLLHQWSGQTRANCCLAVGTKLYVGVGTAHSPGAAAVYVLDAATPTVATQVGGNFPAHDMAYDLVHFNGEVHVGLEQEDTTGAARVMRWNGSAWVDVLAPGLDGMPGSYTYAFAYKLFAFGNKLHVGMMSRTSGHGHVWRRDPAGWVNLGVGLPGSSLALAAIEYKGRMVWAWGGSIGGSVGPVYALSATDQWEPLGDVPSDFVGAHIFNDMGVLDDRLYVGVGGAPGRLSVCRLSADDQSWEKVAGDGVNGSWVDPIASGNEWIYRAQPCNGKLYAMTSGDVSPAAAGIWEMTPPSP